VFGLIWSYFENDIKEKIKQKRKKQKKQKKGKEAAGPNPAQDQIWPTAHLPAPKGVSPFFSFTR
jgi:hypothetical protein